jgi:phenylacetate-coenzyme A ligase PaaK-like adenylate-forming protein/glycosyltransferase involved in cell wall biosynthesis
MLGPFAPLHQIALRHYTNRRIAAATDGTRARIKELLRSQWLPAAEIEELQISRLKRLLSHAEQHCEFYRERFKKAGFSAAEFSRLSDLEAIPPLTKREIQDHYKEMIASNLGPDEMYQNHTGGSTGAPLTFYQTREYKEWAMADIWRNYIMCGFEPGMRRAFLWGSDYDARAHKTIFRRLAVDLARDNLYWVNTFDVDEAALIAAAKRLVRFKPHLLIGYVSSLTLFAEVVRRHGIDGIKPLAIQSSAEVLTPTQRALIEGTFHSKVFDRYGCREVGNIAHECDHHEGLHLLGECNYTEFLKDGQPAKPGEVGEVTVTNLFNRAMPLIRYQNGDLARTSDRQPSCGRGLSLMEVAAGRTADVIKAPSGKFLHGEFFTHLFYSIEGVRQFQVVQETLTTLVISIEAMPAFDRQVATSFLERVIRGYRRRAPGSSDSRSHTFQSSRPPTLLPISLPDGILIVSALFLLSNLRLGGSERKTIAIANALAARGDDIHCAQLGPPDTLRPQLDPNVPLAEFDRTAKLSLRVISALRRYILDHQLRHILCVNLYPLIYAHAASWGLGPKRPEITASINTTTFENEAERRKMVIYGPLLRRSNRLIFGCNAQQRLWLDGYRLSPSISDVIYNGVDTAYFDPAALAESRVEIRRSLKIPESAFVLVSVAQFRPEKNHGDLLKATAMLREQGVDAHAILVGEGPEQHSITRRIAELSLAESITLAGAQADVRRYLKCADVFVQTSTAVETFSNAALEAMAMGLPLALSDVGGSREMLVDRVIGRVFQSADVQALCDALTVITSVLVRSDCRASNRAAAIERFGFARMVDAYEAVMFRDAWCAAAQPIDTVPQPSGGKR